MWGVEYQNEVDDGDNYLIEWFEITDGKRLFKAEDEKDAEWLCEVLNSVEI